jgi:hypothetical protein
VLGLFLLGFRNQGLHPAVLVAITVVPETLIDPEHLSEELTFGPVFFLGNPCDLLGYRGRHRKPHNFGCTSHGIPSAEFNGVQHPTL